MELGKQNEAKKAPDFQELFYTREDKRKNIKPIFSKMLFGFMNLKALVL